MFAHDTHTHTFKVVSNVPYPKVAITYLNSNNKGQQLQMLILMINQTLKYWVALSILYMLLYPPPHPILGEEEKENNKTVDDSTRYPLLSSIPMDVYGMQ
jgi:hypothetical protein